MPKSEKKKHGSLRWSITILLSSVVADSIKIVGDLKTSVDFLIENITKFTI